MHSTCHLPADGAQAAFSSILAILIRSLSPNTAAKCAMQRVVGISAQRLPRNRVPAHEYVQFPPWHMKCSIVANRSEGQNHDHLLERRSGLPVVGKVPPRQLCAGRQPDSRQTQGTAAPIHVCVAACLRKTPAQLTQVIKRLLEAGYLTISQPLRRDGTFAENGSIRPTIAALRTLDAYAESSDDELEAEIARLGDPASRVKCGTAAAQ